MISLRFHSLKSFFYIPNQNHYLNLNSLIFHGILLLLFLNLAALHGWRWNISFCPHLPFTLRKLEIHIIILHDSNLDSSFVFDFLKPDLPPSGLDLSLGRRPFSRKSVHTLTTYHPDFALVLNQWKRINKVTLNYTAL